MINISALKPHFNFSTLVCAELVCHASFLRYCSVSGFLSAFLDVLFLPHTLYTHTHTHLAPYYHAAAQLGACFMLLLGNFRRAILVHCLGLDWGGVCVSRCVCR